MPSDDGLGLDEDQGRLPPAPGGRQQDPKHAVTGAEVRPLHASLQGSQLGAKGKILEDHLAVATAGDGDRPQEQQCQRKHFLILSQVAAESNTDNILANDTESIRFETGRPNVEPLSKLVLNLSQDFTVLRHRRHAYRKRHRSGAASGSRFHGRCSLNGSGRSAG
jgi:hypothetical protein